MGTDPELLAFASGLRLMLIDKFVEIQPGGSRPHFPMVRLKKIPHAVEFLPGLWPRGLLATPVWRWHCFRYIWRVRWQRRPRGRSRWHR